MDRQQVMEQALKYLNRQPHTAKKLTERLLNEGFEPEAVSECVERIRGWGYINDREFGIEQIKTLQVKLKSRLYVEESLLYAGVERGLTSELLEQYYPETMEPPIALKLLERKYQNKSASQAKKWQYLLRAGFSENTVGQCFTNGSST